MPITINTIMEQAFSLTGVDVQLQPQHKKNLMYELIRSFAPSDFLTIKKGFQLHQKGIVDVKQFVGIMMDIMHKTQDWSKLGSEVITLIELFSYIDYQNKEQIKFQDFTNFVIENEGIFAEQENFDEYKIVLSKELNKHDVSATKVFTLDNSDFLGVLDPTQKAIRLLRSAKLDEHSVIELGGIAIINTVYSKATNSLIISTNDKCLNFYNIDETKLVRRFSVPDTQAFLIVSDQRRLLFTGTPSGRLYTWALKDIFSDIKVNAATNEIYKKFLVREPIKEQEDLTCMLEIQSSDMIITGSNDCLIRLYQIRDQGLVLLKKLECHPKGIKCLAYSESYKIIVSCAFDFDVLVWNAYLEYPVAKLVGHEESLNSVYCPKNHPVILSLDSKGILKVWNIKSYQLIQTVITVEGLSTKKAWASKGAQLPQKGQDLNKSSIYFAYKEEFDTAIICLKKLTFYEFVVSHDPKLTDDRELVAFTYSQLNLEIYIGSEKDLRVWSAQKGVVVRQFKKRTSSNIISLCLDKNHRRAFLGAISGEIVGVNVFTGAILNKYDQHAKQISFLGYSYKHSLLISEGWEGNIKIHNDTDHLQMIDKRGNVLRNIRNCHGHDLIMGAYSDSMLLIASASRSPQCCIWDFEKGFFQKDFVLNQQVSCFSFLSPYPLIALGDLKGAMYVYIVKYHKKEGELLLCWNNMYSIQKQAQATVINSDFYKGELTMIMGDQYGYVRTLKFQTAITAEGIVPIVPETLGNKNPYRVQDYDYTSSNSTKNNSVKVVPLQPQKSIKTLLQFKAHNQKVIQVHIVRETHSMTLLTAGDRLCKLWNAQGENLGVLRQGLLQNPGWKFQLHSGYRTKQQILYQSVMKELKSARQELMWLRREKMIPFSSTEGDYNTIEEVDNNEIFRDLKEIEDYLRKNNPKSNKRLY